MAILSPQPIRLLGIVPRAATGRLDAVLAGIPGPALHWRHGPEISAVFQDEKPTPPAQRSRKALLEDLQVVHRRLERACTESPVLPADPSQACCPASQLDSLLETHWPQLAASLTDHGASQQWDVVLRWSAESVLMSQRSTLAGIAAVGDKLGLSAAVSGLLREVRDRRADALDRALRPAVRGITSIGMQDETAVGLTILTLRSGEAAIEAALMAMPDDITAGTEVDLRGPMPPVSFHAVRVMRVAPADIVRSWRALELPERADSGSLHRHWRSRAAACHPDRQRNNPDALAEFALLGNAFDMLRPLLGAHPQTLRSLLRSNGYRIDVPAGMACAAQMTEQAA